jgi:uncharacterized protein (TIGR02996 family)
MRTFVLNRGKSSRFWNIYRFTAAVGFATSSGTTGPGEVEFVHIPDGNPASEVKRRVAEKLAEGYVETTKAPWHGGYESALRSSLEDALVENPDDTAAHMAYADHLIELGDPRGEFIQVQLALEDDSLIAAQRKKLKTREAALLKKHERAWLGPMAGFWIDKLDKEDGEPISWEPHQHRWRRGWIDGLDFFDGWGCVPAARARAPLLRLVRELRIPSGDYDADRNGYENLAESGFLGNVRVLQLGKVGTANFFRDTASARSFYENMPHLEELHLYNGEEPFDAALPHLRQLTAHHGRSYPLQELAANTSMGNLTHLALWPRSLDNEYPEVAAVENEDGGRARISRSGAVALFRSPHLTKLQHLQLRNSDLGDEGLRVLIEVGLLKRLRTLDLLGGCITDAGVEALADCSDLRNLEALNLSRNMLTRKGIRALRALDVPLTADDQYGSDALDTGRYLCSGDCE